MGCSQSDASGGRPPPTEALKYKGVSFLTAYANAYEQMFVAFVGAHCERGVGMYCPLNEIAAAFLSVVEIPELNVTDSIKVVDTLLRRVPGVKLKGIRSLGQLTEYMYCVGMRLKSFPG